MKLFLSVILEMWLMFGEKIWQRKFHIDLGSDQTSLHNPRAGGIISDISNWANMMAENPEIYLKQKFKNITVIRNYQ
jgi:urocanate hydratase